MQTKLITKSHLLSLVTLLVVAACGDGKTTDEAEFNWPLDKNYYCPPEANASCLKQLPDKVRRLEQQGLTPAELTSGKKVLPRQREALRILTSLKTAYKDNLAAKADYQAIFTLFWQSIQEVYPPLNLAPSFADLSPEEATELDKVQVTLGKEYAWYLKEFLTN